MSHLMRPIVLIPARMGSQRLPGKALAEIGGKPMVVQTLERALEAAIGPVFVATDAPEIAAAVAAAGGQAAMTDPALPSGSDRIAAALAALDPHRRHDVIVNLQGDEPLMAPAHLRAALALMDDPAVDVGTLATPMDEAERDDPAAVKIIGAARGGERLRALYFTRAPAPWGAQRLTRHIGVYVWRRAALEAFVDLPPSPLELCEKLEQLRALEAGMRIDAAMVDSAHRGVDTPQDLARLRAHFERSEP
ncbi:MAG: 3-deoxy-manno-octulosonate cytidylyltransferase [Hyphomicrobiales bacterium]|nr:3-deoxy-manno-octulosonate cytidylyltransferase [Hyphomicrobiales bacterium]